MANVMLSSPAKLAVRRVEFVLLDELFNFESTMSIHISSLQSFFSFLLVFLAFLVSLGDILFVNIGGVLTNASINKMYDVALFVGENKFFLSNRHFVILKSGKL